MEYTELLKELKLDAITEKRLIAALEKIEQKRKSQQREGIHRAKERGVIFGRPRIQVNKLNELYEKYIHGEITLSEAACIAKVSRSTIYRRLYEYRDLCELDI